MENKNWSLTVGFVGFGIGGWTGGCGLSGGSAGCVAGTHRAKTLSDLQPHA